MDHKVTAQREPWASAVVAEDVVVVVRLLPQLVSLVVVKDRLVFGVSARLLHMKSPPYQQEYKRYYERRLKCESQITTPRGLDTSHSCRNSASQNNLLYNGRQLGAFEEMRGVGCRYYCSFKRGKIAHLISNQEFSCKIEESSWSLGSAHRDYLPRSRTRIVWSLRRRCRCFRF